MNIEGVFQALVGLGATWVLWVLVALSVFAVAIMLERWVFFWSTKENQKTLGLQVMRSLERGDVAAMKRRLDESPSLQARIVASGMGARSVKEAEEKMAAEVSLQRLRAEKNLAYLGTLGNNAPFVGLLGTVVGIIGAFHQLDASGGQLTAGLMAEIGEALVATAVGLIVALPAVAAFNTFQRAIVVRLSEGEALGRQMLGQLHSLDGESQDMDREATSARARAS